MRAATGPAGSSIGGVVRFALSPGKRAKERNLRVPHHAIDCGSRFVLEHKRVVAIDSEQRTSRRNIYRSVYATVGEMCDALREVWGEHEEVPVI